MNRCGNCLAPHRAHRQRMEAAPVCPTGGTVYREGTEEELDAAYRAEFGDGPPEPIATFCLNNSQDMERAKAVLSPDALRSFFGPRGGGMAAFEAALKASGNSERCNLGVGCDESGICYADAHGQSEMCGRAGEQP